MRAPVTPHPNHTAQHKCEIFQFEVGSGQTGLQAMPSSRSLPHGRAGPMLVTHPALPLLEHIKPEQLNVLASSRLALRQRQTLWPGLDLRVCM